MTNKIRILIGFLIIVSINLYSQPKIEVIPGTNLDFGDMYRGQKLEKIVTIKNVGTDTLRITSVKAQCGCTATLMSEKNLAPNDYGQLSIIFDSQNYNGKVSKQVYITSNDTTEPKITIQFTTNVIEILKIEPPTLLFDGAKVDSVYIKTITITNPSKDRAINILSTETKFDNLKITLMKNTLMPGEQTQLQGVFKAVKPGTSQGLITLTIDHPLQKKFEIKVISWVNRK